MRSVFFKRLGAIITGITLTTVADFASAESQHGIAMYGEPALPPDFVSLPYANPEAPKGGRIVFGNTGGFDTLNPFTQKGTSPWQLRYWGFESLMGRSWDEPFTLYGLLAESIRPAPDRSWVEFTLRPQARFSDGSPVTVDDVIWSYETLGTSGHLRYRGLWSKIDTIEQTGPRSLRITFSEKDRELALLAGMRPILKKAQWQGRDFSASTLPDIPIGTSPYVVSDYDPGRYVILRRNPEYWGNDLPFRRGTMNLDELRIDFFGDDTVKFESFKAGELTAIYEFNADKWTTQYDFPAVARGDVVKSEIPNAKPSGITGLVMNTRRAPFDDWGVREALITAFNFDYINDTVTGGSQRRITSYFSGSDLGQRAGPAQGQVRDLLLAHADHLLPGALEGYELPGSDGTARNRKMLRRARDLLEQAGWSVQDGVLRNADGAPFEISVLLQQGAREMQSVLELYSPALARLGIQLRVEVVDNAQYVQRQNAFEFDMTPYRRDLSLSPGNEQKYYWGSASADTPGSRNLMGARNPAIDAMIDEMLGATTPDAFRAAVRALDRLLITGRYVIPFWSYDVGRIAHVRQLKYPTDRLPIYGADPRGFLPYVWWYQED